MQYPDLSCNVWPMITCIDMMHNEHKSIHLFNIQFTCGVGYIHMPHASEEGMSLLRGWKKLSVATSKLRV